ncbi:MAG: XRE family transcriptional regulator [Lachnospiraceae bacterium]
MQDVSEKIRNYRKKQKITLKELSAKTDLSVSFLSQFECNKTSITLISLKKIAEALELPMKDLFDEKEQKVKFVHTNGDKDTLMGWEKNYASYEKLSGKFEGRKLESLILKMEPMRSDFVSCTHEGEEFIYILEGRAIFTVDGEEYSVEQGESIHYPSTLLHRIVNPEPRELVLLCVVTPTVF